MPIFGRSSSTTVPAPREAVREAFDATEEVFGVAKTLIRVAASVADQAAADQLRQTAEDLARIGVSIGEKQQQLVSSFRRASGR